MEIEFIVVRVGMGAGNVLHHIHSVAIQVDVILAVGVRADFHRADQLVVRVVGDGHVALCFHDDLIGAGVVDGDLALALKVIGLLGDVGIGLVGLRTAAQQDRCGQREGEKNLLHDAFLSVFGQTKTTVRFCIVVSTNVGAAITAQFPRRAKRPCKNTAGTDAGRCNSP